MRIAFVCSDKGPCPPVRGGAIQLLIAEVAPLLARHHDVTVYSIADPTLADEEIAGGVHYRRFPQEDFAKRVCEDAAHRTYDVIQVHNRPNWVPLLREAAPNAALVLSLHNLLRSTVKVDRALESAIVRDLDHIVTVSRFVAADTTKKWPQVKGKVSPMHTGVNLRDYPTAGTKRWQRWRAAIRKQYGIGKGDPVVLFAGRLVAYKGCHIVLDAVRRLRKKHPGLRLLVVGSKWYAEQSTSDYIDALIRNSRKMDDAVLFASYVPVEKMPRYYATADLFVCASQWKEPLARVHYEAMAAGLPIITTARGGNPEVMVDGENGFVIRQYDDPKAFAKAMGRLIENPKRAREMGKKGRKLAEKQYNFERVASDLTTIYKRLARNRKKG